MKPKTCKSCRTKFTPVRPLQRVCSPSCAFKVAEQARAKEEARKLRERKEQAKPLTALANEAQAAFNALRRHEDLLAGYGCISCGTHNAIQWHAGHYRTVKAAKQLRFERDNVHLQCSQCNNHDSGNVVEYRINLVKRIGVERVEALESNNEVKRWSREELLQVKRDSKARLSELKKERMAA